MSLQTSQIEAGLVFITYEPGRAPPLFVSLDMSAAEPQQPEKPSEGEAAAATAVATSSRKKRISLREIGRQVSYIPAHSLELRTAATPPRLTALYIRRETKRNDQPIASL